MPKTYLLKPTKSVKQPVPVANVQIVQEVPDDEQLTLQGNIKCEVVEEDEEFQIIQEEEEHEAIDNVMHEMDDMPEDGEILDGETFITEEEIGEEEEEEAEEVYLNEVTLEDNVNEVTLEDEVNEVTIDESKVDEEVEEETVILNVLDH